MIKFQKQEKGFTLAELLVVIAIMAILIGIAVGSFTGLIGEGSDEAQEYELDAVQTAIDAYMAVNTLDTITARTTASRVGEGDLPATYMRRLPTEYCYTWTDAGVVSQVDCP